MSVIVSGEPATAARLAAQRLIAIKTADETVNNSTTLQDDNHLTLSVDASTTYYVELDIAYISGATPGFKTAFSLPSGATAGGAIGAGGTGSGFGSVLLSATLNWGGAGADRWARFAGRLVTSSAGTFKLQWAQTTANASNTTIYSGSALRLTVIA